MLIFQSCNTHKKERSMNTPSESIKSLYDKALDRGDTSAYYSLKIAFLDYKPMDFLPIALIMANKNNFPAAYYDVYSTLCDMENLNEEDSTEKWRNWNPGFRQMAFDYLLKYATFQDSIHANEILSSFKSTQPLGQLLRSDTVLIFKYSSILNKIK
jgi:hypothetical protein